MWSRGWWWWGSPEQRIWQIWQKWFFSELPYILYIFYILYFLESEIENFAIFAINISKPLKIKDFSYGKTYGIFISKNHTMAFYHTFAINPEQHHHLWSPQTVITEEPLQPAWTKIPYSRAGKTPYLRSFCHIVRQHPASYFRSPSSALLPCLSCCPPPCFWNYPMSCRSPYPFSLQNTSFVLQWRLSPPNILFT